ncbi:MAG: RNA polymerase sigma factor [Bacteroidota bacterium]
MKELKSFFEEVYRSNYPKVVRLCMGYLNGDGDMAKDVAQEVFVKVWQHLESFREESSISTWIYRISVNTCLLHIRDNKKKKVGSVERMKDIEDETDDVSKTGQLDQLYQCINSLSSTNRSVILLELEGLPQKEIADIMGISHEAIRTRIHRIKNELTKCIHHVDV